MTEEPVLHITHIERMRSGAIVTFDDGRCAIYSEALLCSMLPLAEMVEDVGWDD